MFVAYTCTGKHLGGTVRVRRGHTTMGKRDAQILDILTREGKADVSSLAERLGVSTVTMRKDLDSLATRGVIRREHGFATIGDVEDTEGRLARHYEVKRAIAERAAELVHDGETIIIENGSCCALLAHVVASTHHDVTIVTNSAFIADYVRDVPDVKVVLLGGVYQPSSQVNVGPLVRFCAQEFFVPTMFIGADGWIEGNRFTNSDQLRAAAVDDMALQADEVVVLTESDKFTRRGVTPLRVGDKLHRVVTDADVADGVCADLQAAGVEVIRVEE